MESKFKKQLMDTAYIWSKASYCKRRKVGCVIAKDDRIVSIGFNGTVSGTPNKCESKIVKCKCGEEKDLLSFRPSDFINDRVTYTCNKCGRAHEWSEKAIDELELVTKKLTLHAEQNALMFCAKNGISVDGCDIYITTSPCETCSVLIAASGIKRVFYKELYKKTNGLALLREADVEVIKLED